MISERLWKHRFVNQMAELLEKGGMNPDAALAFSYHQADRHYPERDPASDPEEVAYSAYEELAALDESGFSEKISTWGSPPASS